MMMRRCLMWATWVGLLSLGTQLTWAAPAAPPPSRQPAVLFVGTAKGDCGHDMAAHLHKAGFSLARTHHPGLLAKPLELDDLRRYNVLVVAGLGCANADMTLSEGNLRTIEVLNRFLAEGGGVLVLGTFGQQATVKPPQDGFLGPLGLTPLFDEAPDDPDSATAATSWNIPFALTQAVTPSPVTEGVQALWYPVPRRRIGAQNHTVTFTADTNWDVVIRGARTSLTRKGPLQAARPEAPGTHSRDVPLVAIREVGPGRIVFLGITHEYLTGPNATTTLEEVVLSRGAKGVPSGGRRLLVNALRWLAAPSLASGKLGGAAMDEDMLRNPQKVRFAKPYAWPDTPRFPAVEMDHPGAIGARTAYSSGTAGPAEWARAARDAGLSYLVFLEQFDQLSATEFERLKADCRELTTPDLALIPGFTIDDEIGNHYFYFGTTFPYPEAKFLSEDGTVFRSRDPELDPKQPYMPGQLAMTVLDYAYSLSSFRQTCGNYLFGQDAAPFADFFSNWDATAVMTFSNGEQLEDATGDYLQMVDSGQGPLPLVLHLMDSPAHLAGHPWRTVLKFPKSGGTMLGGFPIQHATKIQDYFNSWHFYPDNPGRIYVTSGPEVLSWCYAGPRDYEGANPDDFVWQNYRWQLRGLVRSGVGLSEVAVYDGPVLFRRFLPGGKDEFGFVLDMTHDRQHNLVLIATDTQGKRAASGEQWDRNHRSEEFMCADRNNQLSYGYVIRKDGTGIQLGGNQTLATPNKRMAPGLSPAGTFKNDALLGAPAFDGATGGEPQAFEVVHPLGVNKPGPTVTQALRLLHTGDVNIGEGRSEHAFTDGIRVANVWHTLWKTAPSEFFTVRRRNHSFQIHPDSPLAVFLWEIEIKLRQDLPNKGFRVLKLGSYKDRLWALRSSDGEALCGAWDAARLTRQRMLTVPFGRGAYAALLDSPLGGLAAFPMSEGLTASVWLPQRSQILLDLSPEAAPRTAGESARADVLLVGIPRPTRYTAGLATASNETVERFARDFGLHGGQPAYVLRTEAGTVVSQRYILRVDGNKERGFSGQLTGKLISTLPIAVSGLNDRWSAHLFDRQLKKARPVGVFEGTAWATVRLAGDADLFVGHPVTCDAPDVFVQVTQTGERRWHLELHNPTDTEVSTIARANPCFPPLAGAPFSGRRLVIPAGSSVTLQAALP